MLWAILWSGAEGLSVWAHCLPLSSHTQHQPCLLAELQHQHIDVLLRWQDLPHPLNSSALAFPYCLKHTPSRSIALAGTGFSALASAISTGTCFYITPQDTYLNPPLKAGIDSQTYTNTWATASAIWHLCHICHTQTGVTSAAQAGLFATRCEREERAQTCRVPSASLQDTPRVTPVHFNRGEWACIWVTAGLAVPELHQQQSLCPQTWPNIPGREELRSERDYSWLRALVRKLSASFPSNGCDLQGGSCPLLQLHLTADHFSWFSPLQQTDIFGLVYKFLCSSAVKGLLEIF